MALATLQRCKQAVGRSVASAYPALQCSRSFATSDEQVRAWPLQLSTADSRWQVVTGSMPAGPCYYRGRAGRLRCSYQSRSARHEGHLCGGPGHSGRHLLERGLHPFKGACHRDRVSHALCAPASASRKALAGETCRMAACIRARQAWCGLCGTNSQSSGLHNWALLRFSRESAMNESVCLLPCCVIPAVAPEQPCASTAVLHHAVVLACPRHCTALQHSSIVSNADIHLTRRRTGMACHKLDFGSERVHWQCLQGGWHLLRSSITECECPRAHAGPAAVFTHVRRCHKALCCAWNRNWRREDRPAKDDGPQGQGRGRADNRD